MKRIAVVLSLVALCACSELGIKQDIPDGYKTKLVSLRTNRESLQRKCADLQKQQVELQAQIQWDAQQAEITAGEALHSLGYSSAEYGVNLDTMKIEPHKK